ncbi:hypothetical protein [Winogradskyella aquimaris]|uniref:BppU N-terminal domain-containing protein n=1 Tax=Winogradskyella aquimaris TaxID=864074 RepID=A0ABU5EKK2_9FLAO|nr:hypothetical protein [Winogradskyella aquimaris]MDY2586594.1 hypothetical protein [Winogradskyella aquimaris]
MGIHTITIYAKNDKPTPLTIIDDEGHRAHTNDDDKNLTTELQNGDTLKWVIDGQADITSIDAITQLKTPVFGWKVELQVFSSRPSPINDGSGEWSAEIQMPDNFNSALIEYTITYTINGRQHTQDPKLQIKKKE